jgi:hypothetical protein
MNMKTASASADKIRAALARVDQNTSTDSTKKLSSRAIVQEVKREEQKRVGRKSHKLEGMEYVRLSPSIPADLKLQMDVAIKTTHKQYPTIDTFISEAVRQLLGKKP